MDGAPLTMSRSRVTMSLWPFKLQNRLETIPVKHSGYRRSIWPAVFGSLAMSLCGLAIYPALRRVFSAFPLETLIVVAVVVLTVMAIVLYIGQLFVLGWVVDFLDALGRPKPKLLSVPLDCEQVGEVIVVRLRDNIASAEECRAVERQLKRVIDEHYCDFVLDFSAAARISKHFRGVLAFLKKAARREAEKLGKPHHSVALPRGEMFPVFDDSHHALEEMSRQGSHGWVVLCGVPVGVRAVSW
jgi:hypothetical protein